MTSAFHAAAPAGGAGGRGVGESLILKRRHREDHLASFTDCVRGLGRAGARAEWEQTLHVRADDTRIQRVAQRLKNQHESELHSRRLRLAELYTSEMGAWKVECLANVETPEDRKQKMIQRALELKEQREQERRAIVEEKRMQQYRESCDDCRVEDSRKVQQVVLHEREQQLGERKRLAEEEKRLEDTMAALWDEDWRKKDERERADREAAVKRNEEVKAILDLQVDLCRKNRTEDDAQKKAADRALLDEWHRLRHVEQELERQHKRNDIARARDVKKFNQERVAASHDAAERERQYDRQLLAMALAQETDAQQREREAQDKFKQEQLAFQQQLRAQMAAEAEDQSQLDQIRHDMEADVWAKRDAQHEAEENARQELLQQVLLSRRRQAELKQQSQRARQQDEAAYMQQLQRESEEALQKELREQAERRDELKRNQSDLVRQLEERRVADERKRQAEYLELKRMQNAEKQHKERVTQFAANAPPVSYRRKTAQWYFDA